MRRPDSVEIREARGMGQSAEEKHGRGRENEAQRRLHRCILCKRPGERIAYKAKLAGWIAKIRSREMKVAIWPRTAGDTTAWVEEADTAMEAARRVQEAIH